MHALISLFLASQILHAQDAPSLQLSLRKAVEIALLPEGNTRVEIAQEAINQAEARRLATRAGLLPNLDASVSYQDATKNLAAFGIQLPSIPGFQFSSFAGPFGIFDARPSATQSVLDLSIIRRYQASKVSTTVAKEDKESVRTQVTDQVARAYLTALRAEAYLETVKANLDLADALRKLADSQKRAGTGTGIEVVRADVQIANEKQRLLVAQNERTRSHLQLLRALDLRLDTKLQLTDKLGYSPVQPVSMNEALETALKERHDLKAQSEREQVAKLTYDSVKMERLPSISAFGDYGTIGPQISDSRATRTVGVSMRVPIFDGGRRDARRAESGSQLRTERIRTKDLKQQMELDLRIAFDNLISAELQVKASEEGLQLAEKELEQAQRRYQAGVTNSLEVTDAQTRLIRARDNRISAVFQHNLSRLDLGTAMGTVERYLP